MTEYYYSSNYQTDVNGTKFYNNVAQNSGGAISASQKTLNVYNAEFINNTAKNEGGAVNILPISNEPAITLTINNTLFNNNSAHLGGGVYAYGIVDSKLENNNFTHNNATVGGGLFIDYPHLLSQKSNNVIVSNSTFDNNTAYMGGGAIIYSSNSIVSNSNFTNNNASHYGGGALISGGVNNQIINNSFVNNTAFLYGGAIGTNNSYIANNSFINNSAFQAGAILTINSTIAYNNFSNNNATRGKDIVYIDTFKYYTTTITCNCTNCTDCKCIIGDCNCTNATMTSITNNLLINNTGLDIAKIYEYLDNKTIKVAYKSNDIYYLYSNPEINSGNYFWKGYCIEKDTSKPWDYNGTYGIYVDDLTFVRNSLDQSYVGDYIKVLIILYQKDIYDLKDYIYVFTDGDYKNSNDPIIKRVINLTEDESTLLVNGLNFVNGTFSCYWFSTFINPTSRQNLILINGCSEISVPGLRVVKTANETTVVPNSDVKFTINVYNDKQVTLHNVTVSDYIGGSGNWYIKDWINTLNDAWVRIGYNKWLLTRPLEPGDFSRIDVIGHVYSTNGNYQSNTADVVSVETDHYQSTVSLRSSSTILKIEKIALEKYVPVGGIASFKIVVTNVGHERSGRISVEDRYDSNGWEYIDFKSDMGHWSSSGWSGSSSSVRRTYYLDEYYLNPGESASFIVNYRIPKEPNVWYHQNSAYLYEDGNEMGNEYDYVTVIKPYYYIQKVVNGPSTYKVGDTIVFKISVYRDSSPVTLDGIYVEDIIPDGLSYSSYSGYGWIFTGTHNGQNDFHRFNYEYALTANNPRASDLYIYCRVNSLGHGINYATVYVDGLDPKTDSAEYDVIGPNVNVVKITNNRTVYLGEEVSFTIKVTNDGTIDLNNVTVHESRHNDLIYNGFTDSTGKWIKQSDLSWKYNGTLKRGESSSFIVKFNATKVGTAINYVLVTTSEGPLDDSSNSTNVIIRELTGSKITEDVLIHIGDNVTFTITVKNTYNSEIHNIFVKETDLDGLTYLGYANVTKEWNYDPDTKIYTLTTPLSSGASASFNVTYRADKMGRYTNVVIYGSDETKNFTAENTTFVELKNMTAQKITIDKVSYTDEEIKFIIQINNTGNVVLTHIFVDEISFENLTYVRFENVTGYWRVSEHNGKYLFREYGNIQPGDSAAIAVIFKTNKTGNFTNGAVVGSDQTDNITVNNTTDVEPCRLDVKKITLNETVNLGDNVTFRIVVHNIGDKTLTDVVVRESSYNGLMYLSYTSVEGDWEYDGNVFKLKSPLNPDDNASFEVIFKTVIEGNLTNVVVASYNQTRTVTTNNTTFVINPNMTVTKITLNNTARFGENVTFTIVVYNNGHVNLTNVTVFESEHTGLDYLTFVSLKGNWTYENGVFKLRETLKVGEDARFNVVFNATKYGNLTNIVIAKSNQTDEVMANNTTFIINPNMTVVKNTITKTVKVGEEVRFEIIVKNTGNVDLDDVFVKESKFSGFEFIMIVPEEGNWEEGADNTFLLEGKLLINQTAKFIAIFRATGEGNTSNTVIAGANKTENVTANNTTFIENPKIDIKKITLNTTVNLGNNVSFRIDVKNTGNVNLTDVFVLERLVDGLEYQNFTSITGLWKYENGRFNLTSVLEVNKTASFIVIFKANRLGNLTNVVVGGFNNTNTNTANNNTTVINPNLNVEKRTINMTVFKGQEVIFEIAVKNIGNVNLTNVYVTESKHDTLTYVGYMNGTRQWNYKDSKFYLVGNLTTDDGEATFRVIFKTEKSGIWDNVVIASSNETENKTAENIVMVLETVDPGNNTNPDIPTQNISIVKNTITKTVNVGGEVIFEITVKNTGNIDLDEISVLEDYPSSLKLITYSGDGWTLNNNTFKYGKTLGVNKTTSFRVIFKALNAGNFTNLVIGYISNNSVSNDTDECEITNITNTTVNVGENNTDVNNPNGKNSTLINNPPANNKHITYSKDSKLAISNRTGNPLALLALLLAILTIIPFRRNK